MLPRASIRHARAVASRAAVSRQPWRPPASTRASSSSSSSSSPKSDDNLIFPTTAASAHHNSLATFLSYAERTGLDPASTVYVGTLYEYRVAAALARYGFRLVRVGGAGDYGTDLLGTWTLPTTETTLRVLVQCKGGGSQRIGPSQIRELEGAFVSAPPGWRRSSGSSDDSSEGGNNNVMGLLVGQKPATKGVRESMGRSRWPMGYVCCSGEGHVLQFMWNHRAAETGLDGIDVVARRSGRAGEQPEVVMVRQGKVIPLADPVDQ